MAMLTVEDVTGKCSAVVFPTAFQRHAGLIRPEAIVFLRGTVDRRRQRPSIIVDELVPVDLAVGQLTCAVLLRLPPSADPGDVLGRLRDVLRRHRGNCPVFIELTPLSRAEARVTLRPDKQWYVAASRELVTELAELLGEENLVLRPRPANANGGARSSFHRRQAARQGRLVSNGPVEAGSPAVTRFN